MPMLRPFQGIRYAAADEMSRLVCPPYDVISPDEQAALYDRHEHNAVRLELARSTDDGGSPYADVGELFRRWLSDGVLKADPDGSFYVYRQDFTAADGSRRRVAGVMGALRLEEFGRDSGVLPHERTMQGPKEDRLALLRAVGVNVSPIFAIYRGAGALAPFLDDLENRPTAVRFKDDHQILHRLWTITAPAECEMLERAVAPGPLVIADGHHRYETALAFHREQAAAGRAGDHGRILCFCVDADSEELVVLPYNRAIKTSVPRERLTSALESRFSAERVVSGNALELLEHDDDADHPYLFMFGDESYIAGASDSDVVEVVGERHPAWRSLDVVALHEVVLPSLVGDAEIELRFSRDPEEILNLVRAGDFDFGVLLRALRAAEVVDVATSGERMPQKASYFWPKAITGLVFHSLT